MRKTALHPFRLPPCLHSKFSNGLTIHVLTNHELPIVSAELSLCCGSVHEEPGSLGVVGLMMRVIAADAVRPGRATRLGSFGGEESSTLSFSCLTPQFATNLDMLASAVLDPPLSHTQLELARDALMAELTRGTRDGGWLADRALGRAVWGEHPLANSARTTRAMFESATQAELVRFHSRYLGPGGAHLCIAGDVDGAETIARAEMLFGSWRGCSHSPLSAPPFGGVARAGQVLLVDRPSSEVEVRIGAKGVHRGHPRLGAIAVLNAILSEGFGSRLMTKLRAKRGLAYLVSTVFRSFNSGGLFALATSTAVRNVAALLKAALGEVEALRRRGPTRAELETAKRFVVGSFPARFETTSAIVSILGEVFAEGLTTGWVEAYRATVDALDHGDVSAAAAAHLPASDEQTIVLVGPRDSITAEVAAQGAVTILSPKDLA